MALTVGTLRWCLMSDNYILASSSFTPTLNPPTKLGPVITQTTAVELGGDKQMALPGSVYMDSNPVNSDTMRLYAELGPYGGSSPNIWPYRMTALYTSSNGITWTKPNLQGFRPAVDNINYLGDNGANNLVSKAYGQVVRDPTLPTGSAVAYSKVTGDNLTGAGDVLSGIRTSNPCDGITFPIRTTGNFPLRLNQTSDSDIRYVWNTVKGQFYAYLRGWVPLASTTPPNSMPANCTTFGRVCLWLPLGATPFTAWTLSQPGWSGGVSTSRTCFSPLNLQPASFAAAPTQNTVMYPLTTSGALYSDLDIYTASVTEYQQYTDSTAAPLFLFTPSVLSRVTDKLEIYFGYSRDGENWTPFTSNKFIPLGSSGSYDAGYMYPITGVIKVGSGSGRKLYHYYAASDAGTHSNSVPNPHNHVIAAAQERLDGWISQDAGNSVATATSVDIIVPAGVNALFWNVQPVGSGTHSFKVQLTNTSNVVLPGFSFAANTALSADTLESASFWTNVNVGSLSGQTIRFNLQGQNMKVYSFYFGNCPPAVIAYPSSNTLTGNSGTALTYTPSTWTHGASFTASIIGALPSGLSFNTSTGVISGTPTAGGSGSFIVRIVDDCSDTQTTINYTIVSCTTPSFSFTNISVGTVGTAFNLTPSSVVGTPLTWSFSGGSGMPAGLSLNTSTGVISGTPTAPGWYTISIAADNTCGQFTQSIAIQILSNQPCSPPVVTPEIILPGTLSGGQVVYVVPDANAQFTTTCPDVSISLLNKVQLPNGCWQYSIQINDNSGTAANCVVCEQTTAQNRFPILLFTGFNNQNGYTDAIYPYYGAEPASTGANLFMFRPNVNNLAFATQIMNDAQAAGKKVVLFPNGGVISLPNANLDLMINTLKNHPAFYGWYIADEEQFFNSVATVQAYNAHFKALDPTHPTISGVAMVNPPGSYEPYMGITDITTLTYYPVSATSNCGYFYSFAEYTGFINQSAAAWNALTPAQRAGKCLSVSLQNWKSPYCGLLAPTYTDIQQMWTIAKASAAGADFQFAMYYVWLENSNVTDLGASLSLRNTAAQWATVHKYDTSIFSLP